MRQLFQVAAWEQLVGAADPGSAGAPHSLPSVLFRTPITVPCSAPGSLFLPHCFSMPGLLQGAPVASGKGRGRGGGRVAVSVLPPAAKRPRLALLGRVRCLMAYEMGTRFRLQALTWQRCFCTLEVATSVVSKKLILSYILLSRAGVRFCWQLQLHQM